MVNSFYSNNTICLWQIVLLPWKELNSLTTLNHLLQNRKKMVYTHTHTYIYIYIYIYIYNLLAVHIEWSTYYSYSFHIQCWYTMVDYGNSTVRLPSLMMDCLHLRSVQAKRRLPDLKWYIYIYVCVCVYHETYFNASCYFKVECYINIYYISENNAPSKHNENWCPTYWSECFRISITVFDKYSLCLCK